MFKLNDENLTQRELANLLIEAFTDLRHWDAKALNNNNILPLSLYYLFTDKKAQTFPDASAFLIAAKKHLAKYDLSVNPAVEPVFDRILWNFFELYLRGMMTITTGEMIANFISAAEGYDKLIEHELREEQTFANLRAIAEIIEPGVISARTNLSRIIIEEEAANEELARRTKAYEDEQRLKQEMAYQQHLQSDEDALPKPPQDAILHKKTPAEITVTAPSPRSVLFPISKDEALLENDNSTPHSRATTPTFHDDEPAAVTESETFEIEYEEADTSSKQHAIEEDPTEAFHTTDDEEESSVTALPNRRNSTVTTHVRRESMSLSYQLAHADDSDNTFSASDIESSLSNIQDQNPAVMTSTQPLLQTAPQTPVSITPEKKQVPAQERWHPDSGFALQNPAFQKTVSASPAKQAVVAPADETAAKLEALQNCLDDLTWWNSKISYKLLWGGTATQIGNTDMRVPHHITVFKNQLGQSDLNRVMNNLVAVAARQMPAAESSSSFWNLFSSPPGTRLCGLFQVRQTPMIDLIATVANLKSLSLAALTEELRRIRGNTDWQPVEREVVQNTVRIDIR